MSFEDVPDFAQDELNAQDDSGLEVPAISPEEASDRAAREKRVEDFRAEKLRLIEEDRKNRAA